MDRTGFADPRGRCERKPDSTKRSARRRQPDLRRFGSIRALYAHQALSARSCNYYDFLFRTSDGETQWWWLISNPGKPTGLPDKAYGPFATPAMVPAQDFLAGNHFSHTGTWIVLGRSRDSFSAAITEKQPATWYWFNSGTNRLARIMNIATDSTENDFKVAVLGA